MIGQTLSHYRITAPIGQGGMGVGYKAEDTRLGRPVALKLLADHLARDLEAIERFEREARAVSRLSHPHIRAVHDVGAEAGRHFIVMEFLDGAPVLAGLRAVSIELVLNTMTPSTDERRIWAPAAGMMLICSLAVALSTGR